MEPEIRRLKRLFKNPNPLFISWLNEWKEEAGRKDTKMKYVYGTALKSLRQYPLPLTSGKSCNILKGFGVTLCARLDERLQKHIEQHGPLPAVSVSDQVEIGAAKPKPPAKKRAPNPKPKPAATPPPASQPPAGPPQTQKGGRRSAEYRPKPGSGAFALLVTLRQQECQDGSAGFLSKSALQEAAQPLCSTSLTLPDAGGYYTAWSTMTGLVKKMLVHRQGHPARFSLTPAGRQLADRLQLSSSAVPSQRDCFDRLGSSPGAVPSQRDRFDRLGSSPGAVPSQRDRFDRLGSSPGAVPSQRDRFDRLGSSPGAASSQRQAGSTSPLSGADRSVGGDQPSPLSASPPFRSPPGVTGTVAARWPSLDTDTGNRAAVASPPPLQYRYVSPTGTHVSRKDDAHVSLEGGCVGFLVRCRRTELVTSGRRYWDDPSRAEQDGTVCVFLADSDCAEECPAGPLSGPAGRLSPGPVRPAAGGSVTGAGRSRPHDMSGSGGEQCEPSPSQVGSEERHLPPLKRQPTDWAAALKRLRTDSTAGGRPGPALAAASPPPSMEEEPILLSDDGGSPAGSPLRPATRPPTPVAEPAARTTAGTFEARNHLAKSAAAGTETRVVQDPVLSAAPPSVAETKDHTAAPSAAAARSRVRPTVADEVRDRAAAAAEARARNHLAKSTDTGTETRVVQDPVVPAATRTETRDGPASAAWMGDCPASAARVGDCPASAARVGDRPASAARVGDRLASAARVGDRPASAARVGDRQAAAAGAVDSAPTVVLQPGTFDVLLCVDNQETSGKSGPGACLRTYRDVVLAELQKNGVVADVRKLSVGDFLWVARPRTGKQPEELVLPYVVERKRLDDLAFSIRDSRYREQKFRLKRCGLTNVIYLAEAMGNGPRAQSVGMPESTLQQALTNCQVVDGFRVKRTADQRGTAAFLTLMTRRLQRQYQYRQLESCRRDLLSASPPAPDRPERLQLFSEFHQLSAKRQRLTAGDLFAKMLLQLSGLSADKAAAIVSAYPTVRRLLDAYGHCGSVAEAEALLAPLRAEKSGRPVGAAVSRAVYHLYCDDQLL